MRPERVDVSPGSDCVGRVSVVTTDVEAELEIGLLIEMLATGIVRMRARATSAVPSPSAPTCRRGPTVLFE
jgi:hypothetical protein